MSTYKHILLAADFSEHGQRVSERAKDLTDRYQARLSIIHVVDNLPITDATYGPVIPFDIDLTEELMAVEAEKLHIPQDRQWLELGSPKLEIIRVAEEQDVDLIVVGSHGRHGLALLLGSTANGVLHHAPCDVMAVRLKT